MKIKKDHKQLIIGLQGAAGVGKTAIARKICCKLSGKTVRVSVDVLKDMSCVYTMTVQKHDEHITMAKNVSLELVKAYLKEEYNIIVEFAPPTNFDKGLADKRLVNGLKKLGGCVFLLHASLKEVLKRNQHRKGEFGQGNLSKKLTEYIYKLYEKYIDKKDYEVINTDKIGADKTTSIILNKIRNH